MNQTVTPASLTQPAQVGSTKSQTDTGCLGQIMILVSKNSDLNISADIQTETRTIQF